MEERSEIIFFELLLKSQLLERYKLICISNMDNYWLDTIGTTFFTEFSGNNRILRFSLNYEGEYTTVGISIKNGFDTITLTDWINIKYGFDKFPCFSWPNEEDFVQKVKEMISALEEIFSEEKMSKILKGEYWEHVPFGWFGQR